MNNGFQNTKWEAERRGTKAAQDRRVVTASAGPIFSKDRTGELDSIFFESSVVPGPYWAECLSHGSNNRT
jgi:thioester reductase-like protein